MNELHSVVIGISTMLVFWTLVLWVRNSVVLTVYLLFSVACFFTVHEHYFKDCLYVPIVVIVFALYLLSLNPPLAAVCIGPLFIMVPLSIKLLKPVKVAQFAYVKLLGLTNNNLKEAFDGADVIHLCGPGGKGAENGGESESDH